MFVKILNTISLYAIPFTFVGILVFGMAKKVNVYEAFTDGAKEGFNTSVKIIPYLVAMLVAIGVFRASGAMEIMINGLNVVTSKVGIPGEILPMGFMRPLSGGGATGVMTDIFKTHGPDSLLGKMAAVMMGSTETTFYVLAVYFGSISIKKTRHALPAGLIADLFGVLAAVYVTKLFF